MIPVIRTKYYLAICCILFSVNVIGQSWRKSQLDSANTAMHISFLTANEKGAIQYINLCRLYPADFAAIEVINYNMDSAFEDSVLMQFDIYKKSLLKDLATRVPCKALLPDKVLYLDAKCYANEISKADRKGHERIDCKESNYSECLSFGMETGREIALQWLIDEGIVSLGHRINCLHPGSVKIGLCTNKHFEYGFCAVAEFE